jgi:hypothetical protein
MDLTPGQQRLVFVVVVLLLVGLGVYLIGHRSSGGAPAAASSATPSTSQASASQTPSADTAPAADTPPSTVPAATPVSTAGGAEIYQWLPFTPAELSAAAKATTTFATDYVTWSYTENAAAYGAKLSGLVTPHELTTLEDGYSTSGVAGPRTANKQVSTGSAAIDSINSFGTGPVSITFVVSISQQVASTQPTSKVNGQYTVTVQSAASGWQVSDIELSGLGNQ